MTGQEQLAGILTACRGGDSVAWKALYDAHFRFVCRTARKLGTPEAELEDVVSEVFLVVYRKLDDFQYGRFTTWLYRICANVVSEFHRKRKVRRAFDRVKGISDVEPIDAHTPEHDAQRQYARVAIERILEGMSPKNREVIVMFELEGLSGEEIAERIDRPLGTVWTRLHHARKQFKKVARRLGLEGLGEMR